MACCLFGVMNLTWVGALSAFVLIEKMLPFGGRLGTLAGIVAIAAGAFVAIA
jgi:predicted metal-binding membrane protein